jgi:hypothetical protein
MIVSGRDREVDVSTHTVYTTCIVHTVGDT